MVPISPCLVLMEHYLKQAKFEETDQPLFLALGDFQCPLNVPYPSPPQCFLSSALKYAPAHTSWPPTLSAQHKADLAQASYSEEEISPLDRFWASLCARCLQWGHKKINCQARIICIHCSALDHKVINCPSLNNPKFYGSNLPAHGKDITHPGSSAWFPPNVCAPPPKIATIGCDFCATMDTWCDLAIPKNGKSAGNGSPSNPIIPVLPFLPLTVQLPPRFLKRHRPALPIHHTCHPHSLSQQWRTTL